MQEGREYSLECANTLMGRGTTVTMQEWIESLRNKEEFVQGRGTLKQIHGDRIFHCCLGILGELECDKNPNYEYDDAVLHNSLDESACSTKLFQ